LGLLEIEYMPTIQIQVVSPMAKDVATTIVVPENELVDEVIEAVAVSVGLPNQIREGLLGFRYGLKRIRQHHKPEPIRGDRTLGENDVREGDLLQLEPLPLSLVGRDEYLKGFRKVLESKTTGAQRQRPYVFFVSGDGGTGKTWLVRAFRLVAEHEPPFAGEWQAVKIDWGERRVRVPDLKKDPERISPMAVLEVIAKRIEDDLSGKTSNYNRAKDRAKVLSWQVGQALPREDPEGEFAKLRDLEPDELQMVVRTRGVYRPPPFKGEDPDELLRQVSKFLRTNLGDYQSYDDFTNPDEGLSYALSKDLQDLNDRLILLCLDAYEHIRANMIDYCLLDLIKYSGGHIVWVVSGRQIPYGYEHKLGDDVITEEIQPQLLSDQDIKHYFEQCVPDYPISDDTAFAFHSTTRGLPLAVDLIAKAVFAKSAEQSEVSDKSIIDSELRTIAEIDPPSPPSLDRQKFVKQIVSRFMEHFVDPLDTDTIYLLAMMRSQDDRQLPNEVIAQKVAEGYKKIPRGLVTDWESRYSFIPDGQLDDAMHRFLREYLLESRPNSYIDDLSRLSCGVLRRRLERQEERLDEKSLCERWHRSTWVETSLDLIQFKFWQTEDEDEGWREFGPRFLEALAYDPTADRRWITELLNVASFFQSCSSPDKDALERFGIFSQWDQERNKFVDELMRHKHWLDVPPCPEERLAILDWQKGKGFFKNGNYAQALKCYRRAQAKLRLKEANRLQREFFEDYVDIARALASPRDEVNLDPENVLVAVSRAVELGRAILGSVTASQEEKELVRKMSATAYYTEADLWSQRELYEKAVEPAHQATQLDPTVSDYWDLLGVVCSELRRLEQAIYAFETAKNLDDHSIEPLLNLGRIYYELKQYAKARNAYQDALDINSEEAIAHSGLGDVNFVLGAYQEACEAYQRTVELLPEDADLERARAYANLANARLRLDPSSLKEAAKEYSQACRLDSKWPYPYLQLGKIHVLCEEFDKALEEIAAAVAQDPDNAEAHFWLGIAYHGKGQKLFASNEFSHIHDLFDKSREALAEAVKRKPNEKVFHYYLGEVYYALQSYEKALEACKHTKGLDDRFAPLYFVWGNACYATGKLREAVEAYEQALELSEDWPNLQWSSVHSRLGEIYYIRREFPQSIAACTEALKSEPNDVWSYYRRGLAHYVQNYYLEAIEDFRIAAEKSDLSWLYAGLGAVYLNLQDFSNAENSYQEALRYTEQDQNPSLPVALGAIYLYLEDQEAAERYLRRVIELNESLDASSGPGDRCCAALARLGLGKPPGIDIEVWSNDLISVQAAGGHHFLHEWSSVGWLMLRAKPVPSGDLWDNYLTRLDTILGRGSKIP
jgi:tetratricopeptide (TPR) repeat protein